MNFRLLFMDGLNRLSVRYNGARNRQFQVSYESHDSVRHERILNPIQRTRAAIGLMSDSHFLPTAGIRSMNKCAGQCPGPVETDHRR